MSLLDGSIAAAESMDGDEALPDIMCCMCSVVIKPNASNMCVQCLRTQVDLTDTISTDVTVYQCSRCLRWLSDSWVTCELESRELLALCLKKIQGLKKAKLVDASWVWTEPHSKRLKIKLTVQKEVLNGAILQQSFVIEIVVGGGGVAALRSDAGLVRRGCGAAVEQAAQPDPDSVGADADA